MLSAAAFRAGAVPACRAFREGLEVLFVEVEDVGDHGCAPWHDVMMFLPYMFSRI